MSASISIVDVGIRLGDTVALKGISLEVDAGEVVCIIGPSGAGKSTLLRCINHLERPDRGLVLLGEEPIGYRPVDGTLVEISESELSLVRARIGLVFQRFNLFSHMTALENVVLGQMIVLKRSKTEAVERARARLAEVGLAGKTRRYPSELSGGEQQRVAIARALAMDPYVMLFDEPTSALDAETVGEVLGVLRGLASDGMTMVVATHELGFAREVADNIVFMDHGEIVETGRARELLVNPQHGRTQAFLSKVM